MKYLPDEEHLPYGPETVGVTCEDCGESFMTDETHAAHVEAHDDAEMLCDDCERERSRTKLVNKLLNGDSYDRGMASYYLNGDFPDTFPIHDPEKDRWILEAKRDLLDGRVFLGKWVEVRDGYEPCPECGDTRRRLAHGTNGIIEWHRETCTICERIYSEDAG